MDLKKETGIGFYLAFLPITILADVCISIFKPDTIEFPFGLTITLTAIAIVIFIFMKWFLFIGPIFGLETNEKTKED